MQQGIQWGNCSHQPACQSECGRQVLKSFHCLGDPEFQVHLFLLSLFFYSAVAPVQCCKISFMKCHAPLDPPNLKLDFSWLLHAAGANFLHLSLSNRLYTGALYMDMFSMPNSAVAVMFPCACGNGAALPSPLGVDIQQNHNGSHCAGVRGFGTDLSCSRTQVLLNLFAVLTRVLVCPPFPAH